MERLDGENVSNVLTVFVSLSQAPSAKVRAKHIKVALNSSIYLTNTHIQLYLSRRAEGTCSEPTKILHFLFYFPILINFGQISPFQIIV